MTIIDREYIRSRVEYLAVRGALTPVIESDVLKISFVCKTAFDGIFFRRFIPSTSERRRRRDALADANSPERTNRPTWMIALLQRNASLSLSLTFSITLSFFGRFLIHGNGRRNFPVCVQNFCPAIIKFRFVVDVDVPFRVSARTAGARWYIDDGSASRSISRFVNYYSCVYLT